MKEPLDIGQVAQPRGTILQSYRRRLGLTTAALLVVLERIESTPAIANRAEPMSALLFSSYAKERCRRWIVIDYSTLSAESITSL